MLSVEGWQVDMWDFRVEMSHLTYDTNRMDNDRGPTCNKKLEGKAVFSQFQGPCKIQNR